MTLSLNSKFLENYVSCEDLKNISKEVYERAKLIFAFYLGLKVLTEISKALRKVEETVSGF